LRQDAAVAGAAIAAMASAAKAMERIFPRSMLDPYLRIDRQSARGTPAVKARPGRISSFCPRMWQSCGWAEAAVDVARMKHREAVRNPGR